MTTYPTNRNNYTYYHLQNKFSHQEIYCILSVFMQVVFIVYTLKARYWLHNESNKLTLESRSKEDQQSSTSRKRKKINWKQNGTQSYSKQIKYARSIYLYWHRHILNQPSQLRQEHQLSMKRKDVSSYVEVR